MCKEYAELTDVLHTCLSSQTSKGALLKRVYVTFRLPIRFHRYIMNPNSENTQNGSNIPMKELNANAAFNSRYYSQKPSSFQESTFSEDESIKICIQEWICVKII